MGVSELDFGLGGNGGGASAWCTLYFLFYFAHTGIRNVSSFSKSLATHPFSSDPKVQWHQDIYVPRIQSVPPASIGNIWDLRSRLIFFLYFLRSFRTVPWTRLWCKGGHCEHETEGFPFCLHKYISLFSWVNIEYGFRMGLNSLFSVSLYFLNGLGRWKGQETG